MSQDLPEKVVEQMKNAGLPTGGTHPFKPKLTTNKRGDPIIDKKAVTKGSKRRKPGFVDDQGRVWIRDHAHGGLPEHWDVQIDDGENYFRVDLKGNEIL